MKTFEEIVIELVDILDTPEFGVFIHDANDYWVYYAHLTGFYDDGSKYYSILLNHTDGTKQIDISKAVTTNPQEIEEIILQIEPMAEIVHDV